jgi:hypothetical protein
VQSRLTSNDYRISLAAPSHRTRRGLRFAPKASRGEARGEEGENIRTGAESPRKPSSRAWRAMWSPDGGEIPGEEGAPSGMDLYPLGPQTIATGAGALNRPGVKCCATPADKLPRSRNEWAKTRLRRPVPPLRGQLLIHDPGQGEASVFTGVRGRGILRSCVTSCNNGIMLGGGKG